MRNLLGVVPFFLALLLLIIPVISLPSGYLSYGLAALIIVGGIVGVLFTIKENLMIYNSLMAAYVTIFSIFFGLESFIFFFQYIFLLEGKFSDSISLSLAAIPIAFFIMVIWYFVYVFSLNKKSKLNSGALIFSFLLSYLACFLIIIFGTSFVLDFNLGFLWVAPLVCLFCILSFLIKSKFSRQILVISAAVNLLFGLLLLLVFGLISLMLIYGGIINLQTYNIISGAYIIIFPIGFMIVPSCILLMFVLFEKNSKVKKLFKKSSGP